ncbi:PilW family protein [Oceanidesulfovibrio indonesiensis]|nr:type II secretion system protein [Oceanidesulfovibrio indonesiensis]
MHQRALQQEIHHARKCGERQSGFSLIYIIVAITLLSALSAGVMALTTSSNYAEVSDRYAIQARYAAISGLNHISGMHDAYRNMIDRTFDIVNDNGDVVAQYTFLGVLQNVSNNAVRVNILGTAAPGTPHESRYQLITQFQGADRGRIAFREDFDKFDMTSSDPRKRPVEVDEDSKRFSVGHGETHAFGSFVYTGTDTFNFGDNNCTDGKCDFRWGIRAFMTTWYDVNVADGLVLATWNGELNNWDSVGGHSTHGEMIGYAGDSRVSTGGWHWIDPEHNGIQPPKIGIEIDNWGNNHPRICGYTNNYPSNTMKTGINSGSRFDMGGSGTNGVDHLAVMLWGLDQEYMCSYAEWGATLAEGAKTMDDNTHALTSQFMDANLAFTEDRATGGRVTLDGSLTRVGQAFTLEDVTGERPKDELDSKHRVIAASFYMRPSPSNTRSLQGSLRARLYNVADGTFAGSDGVPGSEVHGSFVSNSISVGYIFTDGDLDNYYRNSNEWRLVTFYFAGPDYYSPSGGRTSSSNIAAASPPNIDIEPGQDYVIVLEYTDGHSRRSIDVAVEPKQVVSGNKWPGNLVLYEDGNWSADSTRTPIYYVHLYEQVFPFINHLNYFEPDNFSDYRLYKNRNAIRYEIDREIEPTWFGDEQRYKYNIRAWVRRCEDTSIEQDCPDFVDTVFSDTSGDLSTEKNPPAIDTTIYLNAEMHEDFEKAIFGFTEATGGSTQDATFAHFVLQFKRPFDTIIDEVASPYNLGNFQSDF